MIFFPMEMYSERRLIQQLMFIEFFDFQLGWIVFLATVREMSKLLLICSVWWLLNCLPVGGTVEMGGILQSIWWKGFVWQSSKKSTPTDKSRVRGSNYLFFLLCIVSKQWLLVPFCAFYIVWYVFGGCFFVGLTLGLCFVNSLKGWDFLSYSWANCSYFIFFF